MQGGFLQAPGKGKTFLPPAGFKTRVKGWPGQKGSAGVAVAQPKLGAYPGTGDNTCYLPGRALCLLSLHLNGT